MGDPSDTTRTKKARDWKYSAKASSVIFGKMGCVKANNCPKVIVGTEGMAKDSKGTLEGSSTETDS